MKFSILIPCFNVAPWLRACLDSVRAQSCADWECVAVDDGSTDATAAILAEAAAADGRFRTVRQERAGVGAARNRALADARGEWVVFLDGDDVLSPDALARIDAARRAHAGVQAVRFGFVRFGEDRPSPAFGSDGRDGMVSVRDIRRDVPMAALRSYLWQFAFRREVLSGLSFARYRRGEDRLFLVEALLTRVSAFAELDAAPYGYRRREGSAMRGPADRQVLLDELAHRRDVVRRVAESEKAIDFADPLWYEWIEDFYLNHWRQLRSVRAEWVDCLRDLRDPPGFSRGGRVRLKLAVTCPWALRLLTSVGTKRHG